MWTFIFHILIIVSVISIVVTGFMLDSNKKWSMKNFISSILLSVFSILGVIISNYFCEYRERHQPTLEDVNDGYAKIDSIGVVNDIPQYKITWIGNQTGKREQ